MHIFLGRLVALLGSLTVQAKPVWFKAQVTSYDGNWKWPLINPSFKQNKIKICSDLIIVVMALFPVLGV